MRDKRKLSCSFAWIFFFCFACSFEASAQRVLPKQGKEEKVSRRQNQKPDEKQPDEQKWDERVLPSRSRGVPAVSAWHTGTAGIIANDAAEISLFNATRIGFTRNTELLFRIAEEPFLPNIGFKHKWVGKNRLLFSSEHTLYYTYPLLKILQHTGIKDLVPADVSVEHGFAMRNELILSWLINPRVFGCFNPPAEKILSFRGGVEFYAGSGNSGLKPFNCPPALYHSRVLTGAVLYYAGPQFDSYLFNRLHYSLDALLYSVDFTKDFAAEANLRLTYYVSRRVGISAAAKGAYIAIGGDRQYTCVPFLDFTYLIRPDRGEIRHGLFKNKRRKY